MTPGFPLLTICGSPSERGLAYGRVAAKRIRDGIDFYRGALDENGMRGSRIERVAARITQEIGDYSAAMLTELEAIARGAQVTLTDIVLLNARSEFVRSSDEGCTSAACLPPSTGGHTLLAQNWDWHPSRVEAGVLLRILPDDGPAMLAFAEAGQLARCGLNEAGVGVVGNALDCEGGTRPGGVPVALLRRKILGCQSLAQAVDVVRQAPRGTSVNHTIASAAGTALSCETTPERIYEVSAEDHVLGHSNHFRSPVAQRDLVDTGITAHPDTLSRAPRIRELLLARRPIDPGAVQEALRDHDGRPESICRHATVVDTSTWTTVASIVMDLDARRLWLAGGPPCEHGFEEHRLTAAVA